MIREVIKIIILSICILAIVSQLEKAQAPTMDKDKAPSEVSRTGFRN